MSENTIGSHTEADDPMLLDPGAAGALLRGAPWRRYAVLGDSIAQGIGDPTPGYRAVGWAERVADALRAVVPGLAYLNTGRMGATSAQVREDQLPRVLEFAPDLVHVICGGNDMFATEPDLDGLRDNLDAMFTALRATGAQLCTFTVADVWEVERMADMRPMRERMTAMNAVIRDVAADHDALLVDFWRHPLRLRPDLMSADLIHFGTGGHAVVATEMIRALGTLVPVNPAAG
ncbi:SGNH/GDSL hydrolase family protein [Nocardia farcinica]|uniref:SGNH/GDSL hydrolase family protein n=1 Tax=Nocardia farcinica TaxID=37329 RepID=UPI001895E069|nr:SGNH/GDSL hydrolase family protein [Nocardia farcinica]MBF6385699.1 SGNH/GDSL hydrolase family protein [Nocardia farcinica]MBF6418575.1 SGNH/GDSL hydrolase family protein [Nocardia farcinica]MBF6430052.1 SGNH/GDSL hydrolase family protein [Nocardia farcinica]MBF6442167.1 SGNH/GDSL hydrolase family protein [Nocardia farcinica]MBF6504539.1 SGNH/GDSL hydrolase family protein [Nocardia farcinica]